ncbi:hypothetical protein [Xanthobacter flavus]|uniref:hypothetical protein n=1 Tax=Xanthobacter flavus TaxID=281 RepID=UPI00372BA74C
MPNINDDFVHRNNIKIFEKKIETETDPTIRKTLIRLLAEEKAEKPPAVSRKT